MVDMNNMAQIGYSFAKIFGFVNTEDLGILHSLIMRIVPLSQS